MEQFSHSDLSLIAALLSREARRLDSLGNETGYKRSIRLRDAVRMYRDTRSPQPSMGRIVARAPQGDDTYTAQDAENGCIPSEAVYVEEVGE